MIARKAMTLREAKWKRCRWPHEIMTGEYERQLTQLIVEWRPWIRQRAEGMAGENEQLRDELEQVALIKLWCRGVERLTSDAAQFTRRVLRNAMLDAVWTEIREIQQNGERLLSYA